MSLDHWINLASAGLDQSLSSPAYVVVSCVVCRDLWSSVEGGEYWPGGKLVFALILSTSFPSHFHYSLPVFVFFLYSASLQCLFCSLWLCILLLFSFCFVLVTTSLKTAPAFNYLLLLVIFITASHLYYLCLLFLIFLVFCYHSYFLVALSWFIPFSLPCLAHLSVFQDHFIVTCLHVFLQYQVL